MEIVSFLLRVAGWSEDGVNISLDLLNEIVTYATKNENATQAMAKVLKSAGNVLKKCKSEFPLFRTNRNFSCHISEKVYIHIKAICEINALTT